jgi:L-ascorbate metabolism protein UlaG (beta-lactamase superfamily)
VERWADNLQPNTPLLRYSITASMARVIGLVCLLLVAQSAFAGLEEYPSLVVADKNPRAPVPRNAIRVTYVGVNGFQFETGGHALLVDPYFTRIGFWSAALNQRIQSNPKCVSEGMKHLRPHPDAILVTHAHFDHLLDVPDIMRRTGARLFSGPTAVALVEACGIPRKKCQIVKAGSMRTIGPWNVHVYRARHDRLFGEVPFADCKNRSAGAPVKASDWCVGEPLAFVIEATGKRIYIDSGGVPGAAPPRSIGHVDLAILGVALPDSRERFAEVVRQLHPRYTLPAHQDDFFAPLSRGFVFGKMTDFPFILRAYQKDHLPGHLILLDYFRPWTLR